jgi:hypothetical protein
MADNRPVPEYFSKIHSSSSISGNDFNPILFLRTANYLISSGKEEAIKYLKSYLVLSSGEQDSGFSDFKDHERVILLLRLLFNPKSGSTFRQPMLGAPSFFSARLNENKWERLPLAIQDGIPFLIVNGYALGGSPETGDM